MKSVRIALWAAVVVCAAAAAWFALDRGKSIGLGVPFQLLTHKGEPITDKDLFGKPHLVFFGFTHCPEICPTTLYEASAWLEALGERSDDLRVYFVSVDPERDTPEALDEYISSFDPRITGITGPLAEIDRLAKGFHVYYRKEPLEDGGYTVDHTASVYMIRQDGAFMGTIAWGEDTKIVMKKLDRLLGG